MKFCDRCYHLKEECGPWGLPEGVVCMEDENNPNYQVGISSEACDKYIDRSDVE